VRHHRIPARTARNTTFREPQGDMVHAVSHFVCDFRAVLLHPHLRRVVFCRAHHGLARQVDLRRSPAGYLLEAQHWTKNLLCICNNMWLRVRHGVTRAKFHCYAPALGNSKTGHGYGDKRKCNSNIKAIVDLLDPP